mmetsp:Transcript_127783/g.367851  ORF Transcript_127783/g.367851 Transcript_127783/m.367851 type:complete len:452 (+) Transcript_127783:173-1528(+)
MLGVRVSTPPAPEPPGAASRSEAAQEEPQQLEHRVSFWSADNAAEHFVLCFESSTEKHIELPLRRRVAVSAVRLFCWMLPARSHSTLGQLLRLHFIYSFIQVAAIATVVGYDFSRSRLLFFCVFLGLSALFLFGAINDLDRVRFVSELLRAEQDIKVKLWGLAVAACLAPMWWAIEFGRAMHFQTTHGDGGTGVEPIIMLCTFIHYVFILLHLVYIARTYGGRLVQSVLHSTKAIATRYDALPGRREEDAACSVCLAEYEAQEYVIRLPCGHVYHASCISTWLQNSEMCPMRCETAVLKLPEEWRARRFGRWQARQAEVRTPQETADSEAPFEVGDPAVDEAEVHTPYELVGPAASPDEVADLPLDEATGSASPSSKAEYAAPEATPQAEEAAGCEAAGGQGQHDSAAAAADMEAASCAAPQGQCQHDSTAAAAAAEMQPHAAHRSVVVHL